MQSGQFGFILRNDISFDCYGNTVLPSFLVFQVFVSRMPNPRSKILVDSLIQRPNPGCYVCAGKPEVHVKLNVDTFTVKMLEEKVPICSLTSFYVYLSLK